jgi:pentatricopeptide repeat protein
MVFKKLPSNPPAEAVGNLLRFFCKGLPDKEAHATVLRLYDARFKGTDLSTDRMTMHLIAKAAVYHSASGGTVLQELLAPSVEAARIRLIQMFSGEKNLAAALAVLRASPAQSTSLYNAAIDACVECESIAEAQKVMAVAVKSGVADTITYNSMVKAFLQAGRHHEAREVVQSMKVAGLRPNIVTFNDFLDAATKTNLENAWPVFDEMRASGSRPNRLTCSILLKGVQSRTKAADVEQVVKILDSLEEDLDDVLLCSVIEACIRAGRAELLVPQLEKLRTSGKSATRSPHSCGSIIRAYGYVHDVAGAWDVWREMQTRHVQANAVTLGCMVETLVSNGETEAGYELINEMLKDEQWGALVNAIIYCSVLKGFSHQKRFDRMWTVYEEMLGHNLKFSIVTFNTLVDACSRNGEMSRIPALLRDMTSQGIQPNIITYSAILKGYCQENRLEECFAVVTDMKKNTSFTPDEIMFNTLLDGCARQGLYDRGIGVLEDMQKAGIPPTNYTLSVLVKLASRSKKLERAFELCEQISTKYKFRLNVHVYSNLINACVVNKDLNRAFEVFEKMFAERVRPDTRGYTLLLRACITSRRSRDAAGLLRAAVGLKDVHHCLAKYDARVLQPQGGLPHTLITEVLEGITAQCGDERLAMVLLQELKGRVKLDPKLQFRLTQAALKS